MTSDDDRIGYLAGEGGDALDEDQRRELDDLQSLLADPAAWAEPPPGLEDAVVAAVAAVAAEVAAPGSPTAAPLSTPSRHRGRWTRPRSLAVAVAAVAAILVAFVLIAPNASNPSPSPTLAAELHPTPLAPDAEGHASFTKTGSGWRIELDATGLPRLDDGRFYQAWLKDDHDVLVPIGSFNEGEDVVLWAGVSPVDYPTITITQEAADGDPASSGQRVLAGPITDR